LAIPEDCLSNVRHDPGKICSFFVFERHALRTLSKLSLTGIALLLLSYYRAFMRTLTVKLPDPLFAEIESAARARKVAKSEIVRERLERAQTVKTSLWSRMEDLVIQTDNLPPDLSSNKEHLKNYGKNRSDR
jgi:hypothetical protein